MMLESSADNRGGDVCTANETLGVCFTEAERRRDVFGAIDAERPRKGALGSWISWIEAGRSASSNSSG